MGIYIFHSRRRFRIYIAGFVAYQGSCTFEQLKGTANELKDEEKHMGIGASAVISLCKTIKKPEGCVIFCDNWFSSLKLFSYLKDTYGILSLCTIRSNRIAGCNLESDKILLKRGRGVFVFRSDGEKGIIVVKWVDNKCVLLASTFCGINPVTSIKRYSKQEKKKVNVTCPRVIIQYNKHMGGVDKANSLLAFYRNPSGSRGGIFQYLRG